MSSVIKVDVEADQDFSCPRCQNSVTERFYGPCSSCRDDLRATLKKDNQDIEAEEYEPKMNVTPNAVATKE